VRCQDINVSPTHHASPTTMRALTCPSSNGGVSNEMFARKSAYPAAAAGATAASITLFDIPPRRYQVQERARALTAATPTVLLGSGSPRCFEKK
jgi:hypothetical protein